MSLIYSKQSYYHIANNIQSEQLALEKGNKSEQLALEKEKYELEKNKYALEKEKLELEKEKTNLAEKFLIKFLREKLNQPLLLPNDKNFF